MRLSELAKSLRDNEAFGMVRLPDKDGCFCLALTFGSMADQTTTRMKILLAPKPYLLPKDADIKMALDAASDEYYLAKADAKAMADAAVKAGEAMAEHANDA